MEIANVTKLEGSKLSLIVEAATMEKVPQNVVESIMDLANEEMDGKIDMTFSDINNWYVDQWHTMNFDKKKEKAKSFVNIHSWIMKIAGQYRLSKYDTFKTSMKKACPTCRGVGLYVYGKKENRLVDCPSCHGTAMETKICSACVGHGCPECDGKGYITSDKKICQTCGLESPFGMIKGSGKILMEQIKTFNTVVCKRCAGQGVINNGK